VSWIQKIIYVEQLPSIIIVKDLAGGEKMAEETLSENESEAWKKFLKKHCNMFVAFIVGVILAAIGAILVFLWFVENAQSTGMVPATLDLWTVGHMVTFTLHLILWEVLLVGVPIIVVAVGGWLWWRKIPEEERKEYHFFGKGSKATGGGGGGISCLFYILFFVKVWLDGNWNVAFATWTFDYLVNSCITVLVWISIIFGIPIALGAIWWIRHEMKKET
jgi:hypothetical protein